jgi:AbrB family looped-hinge helix DNA binding protein
MSFPYDRVILLSNQEVGNPYVTISSRLSAKGQVTIPKRVRDQLGLEPGDLVAYDFEGGEVLLRKVERFDPEFHAALEATLGEWASAEDEEAFGDL